MPLSITLGATLRSIASGIGVLGICGWGGMALNAAAVDKRVKAVAVSTMYDMTRVMSKGYNDSVTLEQRTKTLEQLSRQRWEDAEKGTPAYGPPINELKGGEAQFLVDYHDYYSTPRGFHPRSVNSNGSWTRDEPAVVHEHADPDLHQGDLAAPDLVRPWREGAFALLQRNGLRRGGRAEGTGDHPGASHTDLYDRSDVIPFDRFAEFFGRNL